MANDPQYWKNLIDTKADLDAGNLSDGDINDWRLALGSDTLCVNGQYTMAAADSGVGCVPVSRLVTFLSTSNTVPNVNFSSTGVSVADLSSARVMLCANTGANGNIVAASNTAVTTLDVSSLSVMRSRHASGVFAGFLITGCTNLANVSEIPLSEYHGSTSATSLKFVCTGCALTLQSIENILAAMVGMDGNDGTLLWAGSVDVSGSTSASHATWTAQMLAYEATIVGRGGTVTSNA